MQHWVVIENPFVPPFDYTTNLRMASFKGFGSLGVAVIPTRYGGIKRDRIKAKMCRTWNRNDKSSNHNTP
jgi:hypothetical protein